jgi:hypothetical protein
LKNEYLCKLVKLRDEFLLKWSPFVAVEDDVMLHFDVEGVDADVTHRTTISEKTSPVSNKT